MHPSEPQPRHREAYPRIDYAAASAANEEGRTICVWRDQGGRRVGHARILGSSPSCEQTFIRYMFFPLNGCGKIEGLLALSFDGAPLGLGRRRILMLCPGCERRCGSIYLKNTQWACDGCHALTYRSKLMQSSSRNELRRQALAEELKNGRRPRQHQTTYNRKQEEYKRLNRSMPGRLLSINSEHAQIIEASWIRPEDDEWRSEPCFSEDMTERNGFR